MGEGSRHPNLKDGEFVTLRAPCVLSNADSWREVHEEDQAALRPGLQYISTSRT